MTDLRYPIGPYVRPVTNSAGERAGRIATIAGLRAALRAAVHGLSDAQLDTPHRPGGWTVRQLVHHVADSHTANYAWHSLHHTAHVTALRSREGW
ncbi:MAG: DinB family protein [Gemmatimonadaceae bacterium]